MRDNNCHVGNRHPRVDLRDLRIVPLQDVAEEYTRENIRRQAKIPRESGEVIRGDDRSHDRRNVNDLCPLFVGRILELCVRHRAVGRSEIHRSFDDLLDPPAAADRLVVEFDSRLRMVRVEPLRVNDIRECRSCAVQFQLRARRHHGHPQYCEGCDDDCQVLHVLSFVSV